MEYLTVSIRNRLRHSLSHKYRAIPDEFISDAIGDAYTIYLLNAPTQVVENAERAYQWLFTVASRYLFRDCKRLSRFVRNSCSESYPVSADEGNIFYDTETARALMRYLSPLLQETIDLHFMKGYSYEEVSNILHVNLETVKKRCKRAVAEMKVIWYKEKV